MAKYPVFLELGGRRSVIIGGGVVAVRKAEALLQAGARLVVIAERINDTMTIICQGRNAELIQSKYTKGYLAGAVLVIAATNNNQLNKQIYKDCQELEILCNVVDVPELCDFYVPAVVKRGDLQIAIGTEGRCPAYAGHIRKKIEKIFTEKHGQFLLELEKLRKRIINEIAEPADRKALLGKLVDDKTFEFFIENDPAKWQIYVEELINKFPLTRKK
ncbi:MAG: bifunctional precorrin-2 dehydrogenase/sirohydrochlorin ferrochelatase [Sedimentisphaerales bacterium]|nr:bifunctional precorrin-2 dehydrogenase/sirohydrochlorin ferrochelatase [Sedimentisphaerales bacterium]